MRSAASVKARLGNKSLEKGKTLDTTFSIVATGRRFLLNISLSFSRTAVSSSLAFGHL